MSIPRNRILALGVLASWAASGCGVSGPRATIPAASGVVSQSGPEIGRELEVRMELTPGGYRKLEALGGWSAAKSREDCYFDAFDGRGWAWRPIPDPWKLRIKRKTKGLELQLRHALARESAPQGDLPLAATLWELWEEAPPDPSVARLWNPAIALLSVSRSGQLPVAGACLSVQDAWLQQAWVGSSALQRALRDHRGVLLPTHTALKLRQERELTLEGGETYDLVIGRSTSVDARGVAVERFEVEASPDRSDVDPRVAIRAVSSWLETRGLHPPDVAPAPVDVTVPAARVYADVPGLVLGSTARF